MGSVLKVQQAMTLLNRTVNLLHYDRSMLAGLKSNKKETVVAVDKGCRDAGLRKQQLGYHKSWYCWQVKLLVCFLVLHCVDVGSVY